MRPRSLADPPRFALAREGQGHFRLASGDGAAAHVFALEEDIFRVLVLPEGEMRQPRTWAIAPGRTDVADAGRHRLDLDGFSLPAASLREAGERAVIETTRVRLSIILTGFNCHWQIFDDAWKTVARDRPTQAHDFGWWEGAVRHYLARDPAEMYFGLGEKSGEQNHAGRRLRMRNIDALGYDARTSDPLYKHLPFVITRRPDGACYGLFYDTLADCAFDLGAERDNYHGLYRGFEAEHGDLDYYFIAGPDLASVVRRFTWLTGRPALMPAWSLGFSGSSMDLADAADAPARLAAFADECARRDIPLTSFHLSSGYTGGAGRRHVFTWDGAKFPDPAAFARGMAQRGVRLVANVKPALLTDHPAFATARALTLADKDGAPCLTQFWGGLAGLLDFTNADTVAWWKAQIKATLLDNGVAAIWNDNNEFEVWSPLALARGLGVPARETRALQPLLMMRASRQAQTEHAPAERPFTVSRSGCAGMQRYAQTWSGDNSTSWQSLRYNIKMGLGLALSGVSNSGHDVGGFAGPAPDAELFARWVGFGVFNPRFSIHSWNDGGAVSTPWMHAEIAETVADLMRLRARLQPYLERLAFLYARDFEPMWRPTFYDFPGDPRVWRENDDFMLGADLLVAPVVEPAARTRSVDLPAGAAWFDFWTGERFEGGGTVELSAPFERPPLLARAGSLIPIDLAPAGFGARQRQGGFLVFPLETGDFGLDLFEDDGETPIDVAAATPSARVDVSCHRDRIVVRLMGAVDLAADRFLLPAGETRPLIVERA